MYRLLALVLTTLVAAASSAADPKAPNYYPLGNNNRWEYQAEVKGMKANATAQMKAVVRDKKIVYELETKIENEISKEEMAGDEKGIYRTAYNGAKPSKPITLIRYPIKPGKWSDKIKINDQEVELTTTQGEPVDVRVPAGKYRAVPVTRVAKLGDQTISNTTWYADNVGPVRQLSLIGDIEVQLELTKFTPGK